MKVRLWFDVQPLPMDAFSLFAKISCEVIEKRIQQESNGVAGLDRLG